MPMYRPESSLGYDLTIELPFAVIGGRRCQTTSPNHFIILMCPLCGMSSTRLHYWNDEACACGGMRAPIPLDELGKIDKANPIITTVEHRKAARIEEESARPWNWVFGDLTEADFPEGFAEINGEKVSAYAKIKAQKDAGK